MISIEVGEAPIASVADLGQVPIAFTVDRVCDVLTAGNSANRFALKERPIDVPYVKNYDQFDGEGPGHWAQRFDISDWGFIRAVSGGRLAGGAVIAFKTPDVIMLEGRSDLAVLWDIRVLPEMRGQGIGAALFRAAESWAAARACLQLKIETQNVNVAACKFYARHGCMLGSVHSSAYPALPAEVQLIWYKDLIGR